MSVLSFQTERCQDSQMARCSVSGGFNGVVMCYDGETTNEAGVEHPLLLCGHCMCIMVMRVHGHGFLAKDVFRLGRTF